MLEGAIRVLFGTQVLRAQKGDVLVVPPNLPHAFSAARRSKAELMVIAPGIERFEYFRKNTRIARGQEPPESLRTYRNSTTLISGQSEWESAQAE